MGKRVRLQPTFMSANPPPDGTAARLGCMRGTLSRLPTCAIAVFPCAPASMRAQAACPTPWRLEEVLRIGSLESTDLVASVRDLAIGPDSTLYVAQAMVPDRAPPGGRVCRLEGRRLHAELGA